MTSQTLDCGHTPNPNDVSKHIPGIARDADGNTLCFDCAAKQELEYMRENGRGVLYVGKTDGEGYPTYRSGTEVACVQNWTGRNKIKIGAPRAGRHNIAGYQIHFWFRFDGSTWHGIQWTNRPKLEDGLYCRVYRTKR